MFNRLLVRPARRATLNITRCYSDDIFAKLGIDMSKKKTTYLDQLMTRTAQNKQQEQSKISDKQSNPGQKKNAVHNKNNNKLKKSKGKLQQNRSKQPQQAQKFQKPAPIKPVDPTQTLREGLFNPETFKWTGSTDEIEIGYLTAKIKAIVGINPKFNVMFLTDAGVKTVKLPKFIQNLKENELFDLANVQDVGGVRIPFLKVVDKSACLKEHKETLAQEKSKMFGRTREKKRDAGVKFIKVSWEISDHDLQNQKRNEIEGHIKSGQKVVLLVDTKERLARYDLAFEIQEADPENPRTNQISDLEAIRRTKLLDFIKSLFGEAQYELEGVLEDRVLITMKPVAKKTEDVKEKKAKQNDKKLERQLKQQQREAEKKAKLEEKRKLHEEFLLKNNLK